MEQLTLEEVQKIIGSSIKLNDLEVLWVDPSRGKIYKCLGPKEWTYWVIQTPFMIAVFPSEKKNPWAKKFPLHHIVEEVAHRVRYCEDLKIEPSRVKGLYLLEGGSFENAKAAVDYLDEWRNNDHHWEADPWLQHTGPKDKVEKKKRAKK